MYGVPVTNHEQAFRTDYLATPKDPVRIVWARHGTICAIGRIAGLCSGQADRLDELPFLPKRTVVDHLIRTRLDDVVRLARELAG